MTKKVLLTFLVIWLFSNTGSAQILKNTWIINPQLSGFNLGSTHTEDTGKETFDLGLKVEAGNFIANNLAILVGIGGFCKLDSIFFGFCWGVGLTLLFV